MDLREEIEQQVSEFRKPAPYDRFGNKATIRVITGTERDKLEAERLHYKIAAGKRLKVTDVTLNHRYYRARHVVCFLGDADGKRLYKDEDVPKVSEWPAFILDEICELGLAHNEMQDLDEGEEEPAAKNSAAAPNSSTGSRSRATLDAP